MISLPSAIGLFILAEPIIKILFERGAFIKEDTFYTSQVLSYFALGLPAYIIIKVLVTLFWKKEKNSNQYIASDKLLNKKKKVKKIFQEFLLNLFFGSF